MKLSIGIPTCKEGMYVPCSFAGPGDIVALAQRAERLGFYAVWGTDFTAPVRSMGIKDRKAPNFYEILTSLAYIAGATKSIRLGALTLSLPVRDPVLLAKQVATLDAFSDGRVLLGLGLGAYREEFEALRPRERHARRGQMFLESLEALRLLFTQDQVSFAGRYYEFHGVSLNPKPMQKPLPVYINGKTPDTPERVAKWCSGWLLSRTQNRSVRERIQELPPWLEQVGRDISEVDIVVTRGISIARTYEKALENLQKSLLPVHLGGPTIDGMRSQIVFGTAADIAEQVGRLRDDGVSHFIAQHFAVNTVKEMEEQVQWFGEEVLPLLR